MQMVHLVIVELTNQSLQNPCNGVLTLTKNLIGRTKILFAFIYKQSKLTSNGCYVAITMTVTVNKYDHNQYGREISHRLRHFYIHVYSAFKFFRYVQNRTV